MILTPEQIYFVKECFKAYLSLYRENNTGGRHWGSLEQTPTMSDIDHSALLDRLLQDKKIFEVPPPRTFSYPNYELAEGQEYEVYEFFQYADGKTIVEQSGDWYEEKDAIKNGNLHALFNVPQEHRILQNCNGEFYALYERDAKKFLKKIKVDTPEV